MVFWRAPLLVLRYLSLWIAHQAVQIVRYGVFATLGVKYTFRPTLCLTVYVEAFIVRPRLSVITGPWKDSQFPVIAPLSIGSDSSNQVRLEDPANQRGVRLVERFLDATQQLVQLRGVDFQNLGCVWHPATIGTSDVPHRPLAEGRAGIFVLCWSMDTG